MTTSNRNIQFLIIVHDIPQRLNANADHSINFKCLFKTT